MAKFLDKAGLERFWGKVKAYVDNRIAGSGGSGGEVYSTEETRIGTWIDGRPLYQKTWAQLTSPNKTGSPQQIVELPNVETPVNLFGTIYVDTQINAIPDSYNDIFFSANGYVGIVARSTAYTNKPVIITAQYTKTTDQATISIPAAALSSQEALGGMREAGLDEAPY